MLARSPLHAEELDSFAVLKDRRHLELAAHRGNDAPQRGHEVILSALRVRELRLRDLRQLRDLDLRDPSAGAASASRSEPPRCEARKAREVSVFGDRDRPGLVTLGELRQAPPRPPVRRDPRLMSKDQDVRVDSDHDRPSIRL